jgi:hypothetical protein
VHVTEGPLDEAQPTGPTAPPLRSLVSAAAVPLFLVIAAPVIGLSQQTPSCAGLRAPLCLGDAPGTTTAHSPERHCAIAAPSPNHPFGEPPRQASLFHLPMLRCNPNSPLCVHDPTETLLDLHIGRHHQNALDRR